MTLRLFTSNRLEILANALAEVLEEPLSSALDQEIIVVQSKGMERWVSMQLAQRHGICANYRFPFPNAFVHEVFQKVIPDLPERSPFDPKTMTWKIMKLLPSCIRKPGFETLSAYLGDTERNLKRFQLSERIADTFDQYLLFRPEMIFRWENGEENHWQAVLWRELVKETGTMHRAALGKAFLKATGKFPTTIQSLPERISVFGISALPRFHIQILEAISRFSQINLFLMNPCKEYWGDILSDWEMKKTITGKGRRDLAFEELHMEEGNSLLASMGVLGKDFFDLINEYDCEEFPLFKDSEENNLLSWIQSDILNLRDRRQGSNAKEMIALDDNSVQVHSCHSPMREIEVLHDRLLDMFETNSDLLPRDILVMTPDIETYAPYIQAVFDATADPSRKIPFSISDRSIRKESEIITTFLAILDLPGSRFAASQIFAILESTPVRRKFDITEADLTLVRKWLKDTRIRWGIDREDRSLLGLPALAENTWRAGLERLILGYAMPGQDENMFNGILPYDDIEGSNASVLGRLLDFTDQLFTNVTSLGQPRTLNQWSKSLTELLDRFFMPDEDTEREMQVIRRTLNDLGDMQEIADFDEEIDINVIRWHLKNFLETEGFGFGFITGGVTFCAMLPMRSIPFKVICCVGMNGDAYPRQAKPLGFDIIAKHPKPGDRSRRNDDRYLFLEAILSARKTLYISYVGQNIQDNSIIQPSVVVSELIDYIEQGFTTSENTILDHIFTKHRLQAFSPEYFKKGKNKLFSYSEENRQAAQCILEAREAPILFISRGLSNPEEEWKTVDLTDLSTFFANPSMFLLNKRLGIHLEERASILEDREAFDLKALEKYLLNKKLLEKKLEGENLKAFFPALHASGQLPHGTPGECIFEELSQGVESFVEKTRPYIQETNLEPLEIDLNISGFRLTGRIKPIYPERLLQYRYARVKARDRLKVWIYHLALNSLMADTYPRSSMLAGLEPDKRRDAVWRAWEYSPVENSKNILESLLNEYWSGLIKPLHFFPDTSWTYVHTMLKKNKSEEDALNSARMIWEKTDYSRGESEDAYYQLCFGNTDPLDSEFRRIAEQVFRPFLEHQKEI
ncbi:MAG: exodeoxyribonuclease V subunit gamma [Desulfobacterium sp. 4572_20]|nr:MAG: exodeoxyribonuclease V subunit gamma [Desulfobacterium sp. 4572_20]